MDGKFLSYILQFLSTDQPVWPNQNLDTVPLNSKSNLIFSFLENINQINILLQEINTSYWWILICNWLPLVKLIWLKLNRKEASKPTLNPKPIFTRLTKAQDLPKCHKLNLINLLTLTVRRSPIFDPEKWPEFVTESDLLWTKNWTRYLVQYYHPNPD